MAKSKTIKEADNFLVEGPGGATHQVASAREHSLTTNQGVVVADNQNTLKSGERGPSLLEDFHFREEVRDCTLKRSRRKGKRPSPTGQAAQPYSPPIDLEPSPALSLIAKALPSLKGRKIGVLVTNGADNDHLRTLRAALEKEGAQLVVVAPKIGGVTGAAGKHLPGDMSLPGAPSVFFDAVVILASDEGVKPLLKNAAAIDWVRDAFGHLKVIGRTAAAQALFVRAGIEEDLDEGVIELGSAADVKRFVEAAKKQRVWDREARLSSLEE